MHRRQFLAATAACGLAVLVPGTTGATTRTVGISDTICVTMDGSAFAGSIPKNPKVRAEAVRTAQNLMLEYIDKHSKKPANIKRLDKRFVKDKIHWLLDTYYDDKQHKGEVALDIIYNEVTDLVEVQFRVANTGLTLYR